jgi:hypothetical protein
MAAILTTATAGDAPLAAFIRRHPRLLVLTGAGCSVASGIPEYRDHDGAWKSRPPVRYADFVESAAARRRYWARSVFGWARVAGAEPGAVHRALARLEQAGHARTVVTQNVDALHQRAGSRRVIDLHGRPRRGRVPRMRRARPARGRSGGAGVLERPFPRALGEAQGPAPAARPTATRKSRRTSPTSACPTARPAAACSSPRSCSSARRARGLASTRPWPRSPPPMPSSSSARR